MHEQKAWGREIQEEMEKKNRPVLTVQQKGKKSRPVPSMLGKEADGNP